MRRPCWRTPIRGCQAIYQDSEQRDPAPNRCSGPRPHRGSQSCPFRLGTCGGPRRPGALPLGAPTHDRSIGGISVQNRRPLMSYRPNARQARIVLIAHGDRLICGERIAIMPPSLQVFVMLEQGLKSLIDFSLVLFGALVAADLILVP